MNTDSAVRISEVAVKATQVEIDAAPKPLHVEIERLKATNSELANTIEELKHISRDCIAFLNSAGYGKFPGQANTLWGMVKDIVGDLAEAKAMHESDYREIERLKAENSKLNEDRERQFAVKNQRIADLERENAKLKENTAKWSELEAKIEQAEKAVEPGLYEALARTFHAGVCGLTVKDKQSFMQRVFDSAPFNMEAGAEGKASATDHLLFMGRQIPVEEASKPKETAARRYRLRSDHSVKVTIGESIFGMLAAVTARKQGWEKSLTLDPCMFDLLFEPDEAEASTTGKSHGSKEDLVFTFMLELGYDKDPRAPSGVLHQFYYWLHSHGHLKG
jgi:FtsZ-binding cell division protein ZapB